MNCSGVHTVRLSDKLRRTSRAFRSAEYLSRSGLANEQSMLSGLLKSFDDKPISQEKRATVNSKLDLGIDKFRGLKRKV